MIKKRVLVGLATAGIIGGGVYGFAATLGVTSDNLAAGNDAAEACDSAVTATYTVAYDATLPAINTNPAGGYEVASVVVGGIDAVQCLGQDIQITLSDSTNATLATIPVGVVDAATETFNTSALQIPAEKVTAIHVAIDGTDV